MKKVNDYMSIKQAADFLGVTCNTLRNWERDKKIAVFRHPLNKYRLYERDALSELLNNIKQM